MNSEYQEMLCQTSVIETAAPQLKQRQLTPTALPESDLLQHELQPAPGAGSRKPEGRLQHQQDLHAAARVAGPVVLAAAPLAAHAQRAHAAALCGPGAAGVSNTAPECSIGVSITAHVHLDCLCESQPEADWRDSVAYTTTRHCSQLTVDPFSRAGVAG
jgi:hypothetical protein